MNYFAKFGKFVPHSVIMPSFMTVRSQIPELDWKAPPPPPPPPYINYVVKTGSPLVLRIVRIRDSYDFSILEFLQLLRFLGQPGSHQLEESPSARGIYPVTVCRNYD